MNDYRSTKESILYNQALLTAQDYINIIIIRKWWLIFSFIVGTSIAFIYTYSLPDLYLSSTLIMVERQRIPESYVQTTITSSIQDRLQTISQQILSRTNLEGIITKFALYKEDDFIPLTKKINQKVIDLINIDIEKIFTQVGLFKEKPSFSSEDENIVESLRKSIEVKVVGGNNAFNLSYTGRDPYTVMNVTNTLSNLFIEENLKIREQQAEGTTEFLESELVEAKRDLEKQEKSLKEFKAQHMGALPEQMNANLRTLDRLQMELQSGNNELRNVEDRKIQYEQQIKEHERQLLERQLLEKQLSEKQQGGAVSAPTVDTALDLQMARLERLRDELTRLRGQFNENYPDVVLVKNQIREIEVQLAGESAHLKSLEQMPGTQAKRSTGDSVRPQPSEQTPSNQLERLRLTGPLPHILKAQLQSAQSDIELLRERQKRTSTMIREFERRVEDTFANEQKLMNVTRDYEMSQQSYQTLLQKRLNARISENLEKRQKGERFRILDPANLPQKPYKPNRPKMIALGSLLSMGLGIGLIFVKEYFRPAYRKAEDLHGGIDLPTLGVIPNNKITQKRNRSLVTMKEPDSIIAEQYRVLFTRLNSLNESKTSLLDEANPYSVFALSSAIKDEGKTITSLNLAVVAARDFDKKTLLIEGDLRKPTIAAYLDLKGEDGFINSILNNTDIQSSLITFGHHNLSILLSGRGIGNPSLILSSPRMKQLMKLLRERYDYIFIDSPPILGLPDMNIMEGFIDGVILIVRSEKTPRDTIAMAARSLQTNKLIGYVLNDVRQALGDYYGSYSRKV